MSKKKQGKKLKSEFKYQGKTVSKYKRILDIKHVQGRPGEDFYVAVDEDGVETQIETMDLENFKKNLKK